MMSIQTLVKDIYRLFDYKQKVDVPEDRLQEFAVAVGNHVKEALLRDKEWTPKLRMSNIGTPCKRKLWYSINQSEKAEPLSAPNKIKFLFGHILEEFVLFLAELAGHDVKERQANVSTQDVNGRIDAVIDDVLVDVKSASSRSFDKFVEHLEPSSDSFGYLRQLGLYAHSTGHSKAAFLAVDKQLGKIHLDPHDGLDKKEDYEELVNETKFIVSQKIPPPRAYEDEPEGKSGNRKLGVVCSYCDFKNICWPELRTFYYSNGPKYLTKVIREPKVEENNSIDT